MNRILLAPSSTYNRYEGEREHISEQGKGPPRAWWVPTIDGAQGRQVGVAEAEAQGEGTRVRAWANLLCAWFRG